MIFLDSDKQNFECKIVNIFLPISLNVCFGCLKYPQHRFWLRNKEIIVLLWAWILVLASKDSDRSLHLHSLDRPSLLTHKCSD